MFGHPLGKRDGLAAEDVLELESRYDAVGDLLLPFEIADAELHRFFGLIAPIEGEVLASSRLKVASEWVTELLAGIPEAEDGLGGLLSVLDRLGSFIIDQPVQLRAFLVVSFEAVGSSTIPKEQVTALLSILDAAIAGALQAGVDDGSVRSGIDPGYEAAHIIDTGLGMAYRWVVDPHGYDFAARVGVWRCNVRSAVAATP